MPARSHARSATKLKFVGRPEQYIAGVPQADLLITETPNDETQVTEARARELVASKLYAPIDGEVPAPESTDEGAAAPEEA
jgi:hypothetical protein